MPTPMEMSVREIIYYLQETGHQITYYQRKDGGVLIRSIDGVKYLGAKGNIAARALVGVNLSQAREKQLKAATTTKKQLKKAVGYEEVKTEWRRVRDVWRQAFPPSKRKKNPIGTFSWRRIRYALIHYGREEALRRIYEAERYAQGLANTLNVEHLIAYIKEANLFLKNEDFDKLAKDIEANIYSIKEDAIYPAYQALYELNHGANPSEVARKVRRILSL